MAGLARQRQQDFAAGAIRSSTPEKISSRGTFDVLNGLHDDDGVIYRRGPAVQKAASATDRARWVWDGVLGPNLQRTVTAGTAGMAVVNAADDTLTTIPGAGGFAPALPFKPAVLGGLMFLPDRGGIGSYIYGGSRPSRGTSSYITGTVSVTNGSAVVTGAGTGWVAAGIVPGDLFTLTALVGQRAYVVKSVDSATQITLTEKIIEPTAAALSYYIDTLFSLASLHLINSGAGGVLNTQLVCAHENRLVWLDGKSRIRFTPNLDPATGNFRTHSYVETNFHEVPAGVEVVALESLRDRLLVFTTAGLYAITNMAFDLVDERGNVQQRMEKISDDLVAWGSSGICEYKGALVVPALDGLYLVDGLGPPVPVGEGWAPYLRDYTRGDASAGGATVHEGHYLLPIILAGGTVFETMVARLDRPVDTGRGIMFPWSRFDGPGAENFSYARRTRPGAPVLLLAGSAFDSKVLADCYFFRPGYVAGVADDYDEPGTGRYSWSVTTRQFTVADGAPGVVRRARIRYELDDPLAFTEIDLRAYIDGDSTLLVPDGDGATEVTPPDSRRWHAWELNLRCSTIQFYVVFSWGCNRLKLYEVDFWVRAPGSSSRGLS